MEAFGIAIRWAHVMAASVLVGIFAFLTLVVGPAARAAGRQTVEVLTQSVWPAGSLQNTRPAVPADQTLYSVRVEIRSAEPESPAVTSLARPGLVIEAFSDQVLAAHVVGHTIEATVTVTGDGRSLRWWLSGLRVRP